MAASKMSKSELVSEIAGVTELSNKDVRDVFETLSDIA